MLGMNGDRSHRFGNELAPTRARSPREARAQRRALTEFLNSAATQLRGYSSLSNLALSDFRPVQHSTHPTSQWGESSPSIADFVLVAAAPAQPCSQQFAGPRQPPLDGADRTSKQPGDLLVTLAFHVGVQHQQAVLGGQAVDLRAKEQPELVATRRVLRSRARFFHLLNFHPRGGSGATFPRSDRGSVGHLVKPAPQDLAIVDGAGLPRQHEEGCLKGVFGVLVWTEDVPADPAHHRSVPLDQRLEGDLRVFLLSGQELIDQLLIRSHRFHQTRQLPTESWSNSAI